MLVLNCDFTYTHLYTKGSSGKTLVQEGEWKNEFSSIYFDKFVAWDLLGVTPEGVMYPDPVGTAFPLGQNASGNYEINVGPDRGEKFIQIERFN